MGCQQAIKVIIPSTINAPERHLAVDFISALDPHRSKSMSAPMSAIGNSRQLPEAAYKSAKNARCQFHFRCQRSVRQFSAPYFQASFKLLSRCIAKVSMVDLRRQRAQHQANQELLQDREPVVLHVDGPGFACLP